MMKRVSLANGLLVAASIGLMPATRALADEPNPPQRSASPAPGVDADRYLLLSDGRLIAGRISHDDTHYTVAQKLGVIRFPKRLVERSFDTVQEAYQYRLERMPEDDPGERLRLARWCLNLHLTAEAKTQLERVLEISPEHDAAKAMLQQIGRSDLSGVSRPQEKVDAEVRRTAAEDVAHDRVGELDSAVLRGAERRMGISGLPVIFDLPQATAILRAQEFKRDVHPILQACCARCHNGEYQGNFQLVPASKARQRTPDALRANLDATLRLVDPENPAKSELLSSTLRAHGTGGRRRPIFTGYNDPAYQILATWVNSLRPAAGAPAAAAARGPAIGESGETFAADRIRPGAGSLEPLVQGMKSGDPRRLAAFSDPTGLSAAGRLHRDTQGPAMVSQDQQPGDDEQFPLPYMLGGPRPKIPFPATSGVPQRSSASPARAGNAAANPNASGADPGPAPGDGSVPVPAAQGVGKARTKTSPGDPAPKKKPVKLDPALLQQLLKKNANRPISE